MPLWLCLCCFLDLNFYCLFLPNSNLSLFQLNGLKSFTSSYKKSSLDAQSWGRYLLFLFLPWLTYFKVFYHFCMEIIPTRLSTFKRGAVIYQPLKPTPFKENHSLSKSQRQQSRYSNPFPVKTFF